MESLLNNTLGGKNEKASSKLCRVLTFCIAVASLVMSIIGLSLGNKSYLQYSLFTYEFPNWGHNMPLDEGTVVSMDNGGRVVSGAGTTIYRDAANDTALLENVKIWGINDWLYLTASTGLIRAYEVDPRDLVFENQEWEVRINNRPMEIDNFVRLSSETFLLMGSGYLYPFSASFEWVQADHRIAISLTFGQPTSLPSGASYPKIDTLDDSNVCISYEGSDNLIYAMTAVVTKDNTGTLRVSTNTPQAFSEKYGYHGIAGLSKSNFIVAATGPQFNSSGFMQQQLRAALVTVTNEGTLDIGDWVALPWSMSFNYFDMDNFDERYVVVAYVNSMNNNGIECVLLDYDQDTNTIYWGSSMTYKSGGAVIDDTKIVLSMLSPDRFSLAYPDAAAHGSLALGLIELTSTGDIVKSSAEFIITRPTRSSELQNFYYDVCNGGWSGRFIIAESTQTTRGNSARLHIGTYGPRPVGIVRKNLFGTSQVQFAGTFTVDTNKIRLTPGYMYYTNSDGELKRGRPAGFAHREFGAFYVVADDNSILSLHNQIGMAVSESELLIKLY